MKAGIVMSSTAHRHGNLSANHYLGDVRDVDKDIETCEATLQKTRTRLANLKEKKRKKQKFHSDLVDSGDVKPIHNAT